MFSKKELKALILPLMFQQLFSIAIGLVDVLMVSSAGEAAVSGVSLGNELNYLTSYLIAAMATGGTVLVSQLLGKKDPSVAREASRQLFYSVTIISTIITALIVIFNKSILHLVYGSVENDVMANVRSYFFFTVLSLPFSGMGSSIGSIFRSMGNSKTPVKVSVFVNILNVIGNAVMIYVFDLGATGAALATLISIIIGTAILCFIFFGHESILRFEHPLKFKPDFKIIKEILRIGIPSGIEDGMFQFGRILTQSLVSTLGTVAITANAIANSLTSLQFFGSKAIGVAIIPVVGRCVGAGKKDEATAYTKKLLKQDYLSTILFTTITICFLKPIISMYNVSPESAKTAYNLLFFHGVSVSAIHALAFTVPNAFRAASDVKFPLVVSMCAMWLCRITLSYLFIHIGLGIYGIWLAMVCDWAFRAVIYIPRFVKGTWLKKYKG